MNRRGILKLMGIPAASLAATASIPSLARVAEPNSPQAAKIAGPFESRQAIYVISSHHQEHDLAIRVLLPAKLDKIASPGVLYVLPTEPEIQFRVGDGLTTVERLDMHNKFGLIAVAPSFSDWPWYANHPTDPKMQQEAYFLEDVVPFIDSVYPNPSKKRLLVGFSKSGNGAYQLLLRHPEVFLAASIWDPPLMYKAPSEFEMNRAYGDQANFDKYCIPQLLTKQANLLRGKPPRLGLFGYSYFGGPHPKYGQHIEEAHALMERLRIPHIYDDSVQREHRWDSRVVGTCCSSIGRHVAFAYLMEGADLSFRSALPTDRRRPFNKLTRAGSERNCGVSRDQKSAAMKIAPLLGGGGDQGVVDKESSVRQPTDQPPPAPLLIKEGNCSAGWRRVQLYVCVSNVVYSPRHARLQTPFRTGAVAVYNLQRQSLQQALS